MPDSRFDALSTAIAWAIRTLIEQGLTPQQLGRLRAAVDSALWRP